MQDRDSGGTGQGAEKAMQGHPVAGEVMRHRPESIRVFNRKPGLFLDLTPHRLFWCLTRLQTAARKLPQATLVRSGSTPIRLLVKDFNRFREIDIDYHDGLRYPALERIEGQRDWLTPIFTARK